MRLFGIEFETKTEKIQKLEADYESMQAQIGDYRQELSIMSSATAAFSDDYKFGWTASFDGDTEYNKALYGAYANNPWAYACVNRIAESVASLPWIIYDSDGEINDTNKYHELISDPNPHMSWYEMLYLQTLFLMIQGKMFFMGRSANAQPSELVEEPDRFVPERLFILPADKTQAIYDTVIYGKLIGVVYKPSPYEYNFGSHQVTDVIIPDPRDLSKQFPPMLSALNSILVNSNSNKWLNDILVEGGTSTTGFSHKDPSTREKSDAAERSVRVLGRQKQRFIYINDLIPHPLTFPPNSMAMAESKDSTKIEICTALGVPPVLVGDLDNSALSNYKESVHDFYDNTVLNKAQKIADELNVWLGMFDDFEGYKLGVDKSKIKSLQEDENEKTKRESEQVRTGTKTINEIREGNGDPGVGPAGDVPLVDMRLQPLSFATGEQSNDNELDE